MSTIEGLMHEMAGVMGATPLAAKSDNVNCAETDGKTFFYNPEFMARIETAGGEDGVRFVLAHEMGHQVGGMENDGHAGEYMADELATRALAQMGADFDGIAGVFGELDKLNPHGTETHPAASVRKAQAHNVHRKAPKELEAEDDDLDNDDNKRANPNVKDVTMLARF
jgi:hypothetical protein